MKITSKVNFLAYFAMNRIGDSVDWILITWLLYIFKVYRHNCHRL